VIKEKMKDKNLWLVFLLIVLSLIIAIAAAEVVSAADTNDTEEDDYYPWKASDFEDKGNFIHIDYFMNNPRAAVAIIAFVKRSKELAKHVFVFQNVSFGLDAKAEKYYQAILAVHNKTGFNEDEYPPSGLTLPQAKEIFYIDRDEQALFCLSEENNNLTGRLLYYTLLGIYHKRLCPKDAGSAIAVMKDAEGNTSNITIHKSAYHLATIAYFHGRERVDQCIAENEDLPIDELKQIEMMFAIANEPEPLPPSPTPAPRRRYDYWRYEP
jgi:hypothetical protein